MNDRRKHPRLHFQLKVDVRGEHQPFSARTRDISEGGLYLRTPSPIRVGAEIHLALRLGHDHIVAIAEVAWQHVDAEGRHLGIGVNFTSMSPHGLAVLRRFLADNNPAAHGAPAPVTSPPRPRSRLDAFADRLGAGRLP